MAGCLKMFIALMRHGEAVDTAKTGKDIDRPLSGKGIASARKIGKLLCKHHFHPRTILCSPALRTQQTLDALELDTSIKTDFIQKLYYGSINDYLSLIESTTVTGFPLLLIGHNPVLSSLATELCNPANVKLSLPLFLDTAHTALFEFSDIPVKQLAGRGNLLTILKP